MMQKNTSTDNQGFTLLEVMIVITIVSIAAAFSLTSYHKSIRKAQERDALVHARSVHASCSVYKASTGSYWNTGAVTNVTTINTNLGLNIIPVNGATFNYLSDGVTFRFRSTWNNFTIEIDEAVIGPNNPCCQAGACPTLSNC